MYSQCGKVTAHRLRLQFNGANAFATPFFAHQIMRMRSVGLLDGDGRYDYHGTAFIAHHLKRIVVYYVSILYCAGAWVKWLSMTHSQANVNQTNNCLTWIVG